MLTTVTARSNGERFAVPRSTANDASNFRRFESWMRDRQFTPPEHMRIVQFPGTGRGVITSKFVQSGEILVSIPEDLLVTTDTVLESDFVGSHLRTFCGARRLSPEQVLYAFLMCERLRNDSSPFEPYLAVLPVKYTTPPFLPRGHLRHFNTDVQTKIGGQKRRLKAEYVSLRPFLEHVAQFLGKQVLDFRLFLWARFTVNTRAVYWRRRSDSQLLFNSESDCQTLAPFLDLLNHSCDVRVKAGFNEATRTYDIVTLDDVAAHSQVFINYGPHDDVTLLLEYGFVSPHNPHSVVEFSVGEIQECYLRVFGEDSGRPIEASLQTDLGLTWDGPTWCLTSTLKTLIRDQVVNSTSRKEPHERLSDSKDVLLLRNLIAFKLEKVAQMVQRSKCRSRASNCSASTMSTILIQEEIDILKKHLIAV